MAKVPTIIMNNGYEIPAFGLGTYKAELGEAAEVAKNAIDIGYRYLDCAWLYSNEKEIGEGIRAKLAEGSVKRDELFISTKLWNTFHAEEDVVDACRASLKNLGLPYVDMYLIHWPCAQKAVGKMDYIERPFQNAVSISYDILKTWKGMEKCVELGLTKSIGLSNFNSKQVQRILDNCRIKPAVNQIEVNIHLNNKKLIKFCRERQLVVEGYSPLGNPARPWLKPTDPKMDLNAPKIKAIGKKYGKTGPQVILRYVYQLGTIPIPKTSNVQRLKENIDIFDFKLTEQEMAIMDSFHIGARVCPAEEFLDSPEHPFKNIEF